MDLFELDDPERLGCWGICYEDGEIRLNLRRKRNMRLDGFDSILDTLVHELAHLKHLKHNKEFWLLHKQMKRWLYNNLYY